jgi:hypothetical protein
MQPIVLLAIIFFVTIVGGFCTSYLVVRREPDKHVRGIKVQAVCLAYGLAAIAAVIAAWLAGPQPRVIWVPIAVYVIGLVVILLRVNLQLRALRLASGANGCRS